MNDNQQPDRHSEPGWPNHDTRPRVPDTALLRGSDAAPPAAVKMLDNAVQGAHETIDGLAERAAPVVRQLGERVSAAQDVLHDKTAQVREKRDVWVEGMRDTVRSHPLAAMATALALGAVIARLRR